MVFILKFRNWRLTRKYGIDTEDPMTYFLEPSNLLNIVAVFPEFDTEAFGKSPNPHERTMWVGAITNEAYATHRPVLDNHLARQALEEWITRPSTQKLVYVSLGSVLHNHKCLFDSILKGIQHKYRIVVAAGDSLVYLRKKYFHNENIFLVRYAPQATVLKKAHVFITHCGMNSVNEAIEYSVPMVGIPLGNDQPRVATVVCEQHGMGIRLDSETLNSSDVDRAVAAILNNSEYKRAVEKWSKILHARNGARNCADLILSTLINPK